MSRKSLMTLAGGVAILLSAGAFSHAAELKISGAAATANAIINPNKAVLEKETGLTLNVTVNGDGNGVKDLYAGKVDVAMIAAPLKATEAALNKTTPGSVSVDGFELATIGSIGIKFIVNAANPVKSLTEAQLKDIFAGKITSWKDVGGGDQPILIVAEAPGFGTRSNIVASFGAEISDKARVMQALAQVSQVVAQAPNAIGYGNASMITNAVTVIPGTEVKQMLGLATKGPASPEAKKLIEAASKLGTPATN